jgi:uncharacterized repeat protein (TIGR01451 family)
MRHGLTVKVLTVLMVALGSAFAQQNPAQSQEEDTVQGERQNPIEYRIETYVVDQRTQPDGSVQEQFVEASTARPGQIVEYRIIATNTGDTTLPPNTVIITGPVPQSTRYVEGSATPSSEEILTEYSADGQTFSVPPVTVMRNGNRTAVDPDEYRAVRWTLLIPLEPEQEQAFIYRVVVD